MHFCGGKNEFTEGEISGAKAIYVNSYYKFLYCSMDDAKSDVAIQTYVFLIYDLFEFLMTSRKMFESQEPILLALSFHWI